MTMPQLSTPIPAVDEDFLKGGGFEWVPGEYVGTLKSANIRPNEGLAKADSPWDGFATLDVEEIAIDMFQINPLDVEIDPGNQHYFYSIVFRDGDHTWGSIDPSEWDVPYRKLRTGLKRFVTLAEALGQASRENGRVTVNEDFFGALTSGAFDGQEIGFRLDKWKIDGNSGTYLAEFFAAP